MEKQINGITFVLDEMQSAEERDVRITAVLEVKQAKVKKNKFVTLSAKGKYLRGSLDNEEILVDDDYYDIRLTQSCGITLPVDPSLDGIYIIDFVGRAWIDTRENAEEEALLESYKRPTVYLKGHDFHFAKKGNLIKK